MTNPFENDDAQFVVLRNTEGQYSIWPVSVDVPDGWDFAFGEASRADCAEYVEDNWTDMRPQSLIDAMNGPVKRNL
jgi:MbtH protein